MNKMGRIGLFFAILLAVLLLANIQSYGQKVEIEAPHSLSKASPTGFSTGDGMGVKMKYTVLDGEGTDAAKGTLGPPAPVTTGAYTVHENVTNTTTEHAVTPAGKTYDSTPQVNYITIDHDGSIDILHPDGTFTDPIYINATPFAAETAFEKRQEVTLPDGTLLTITITSIPHEYILFNSHNPPHHFDVGSGAATVTVNLLKPMAIGY